MKMIVKKLRYAGFKLTVGKCKKHFSSKGFRIHKDGLSKNGDRIVSIYNALNYFEEHIKGTLNYADRLARMPQTSNESNYTGLIERKNIFDFNSRSIAKETTRDAVLSKVPAG